MGVAINDPIALIRERLKAAAIRPNVYGYKPYAGVQVEFHKATERGRIFLAGNRSGKTVSGAVEAVWYLTGTHPYRKTPEPPVYGRGTAVDIEQGLNKIMLPEIQRWLPNKYLRNGSWEDSYDRSGRTLTLTNGSKMDFLTNEQDAEKHAGTSRNFVWFDEEPDEIIFNEDTLRLVDVNGDWWMSMTPLLGFTWIYRNYYRPAIELAQPNPGVAVFLGSTYDNPHISAEVLDEITAGMSDEEKEARRYGKFMAASGLVYPSFGRHNVLAPINPRGLVADGREIYCAMDSGLRHPTVFLWAYVDDGRIIVFHEYVQAERTVAQHCKAILEWERSAGLKDRITYRIGDPSIEQRSLASGTSIRSMYSEGEIFIGLANNDVDAGINRVRTYLERLGLYITEDCPHLIGELQGYRWDTFSSKRLAESKAPKPGPKKVHDDAADALRYLVMSRPDDEFQGWAEEIRAPWLNASTTPTERDDGVYAYSDLEASQQSTVHQILGDDW